ncbi:CcdB family protein [Rheinheimera sp. EpRS3]|uniref:CcdB family protein n=1 Tax=Rheinheimera sp. EpRS3 TaxID=1712383 RepID=UPI0007477D5F|nr:CcdB family protein [Rheinheimera sp. EpRS3]KUM53311.1 plasmid maintenance protein CcdB [Rheinheimera sp. EpRS3]
MARFDVYLSGSPGLLLDVQTNLLAGLNTRVVVPLLPLGTAPKAAKRLNPIFDIENQSYLMATQFMAAIPETELKQKIGSLIEQQQEVSEALDMLLVGF